MAKITLTTTINYPHLSADDLADLVMDGKFPVDYRSLEEDPEDDSFYLLEVDHIKE